MARVKFAPEIADPVSGALKLMSERTDRIADMLSGYEKNKLGGFKGYGIEQIRSRLDINAETLRNISEDLRDEAAAILKIRQIFTECDTEVNNLFGGNAVNDYNSYTSSGNISSQISSITNAYEEMKLKENEISANIYETEREPENIYESSTNTADSSSNLIPYLKEYCYDQEKESYGYKNHTWACSTFALATALSIRKGERITPDKITTTNPDGTGTYWPAHGATRHPDYEMSESEILKAIDAELAAGKPALIHSNGHDSKGRASEHWATVIGKDNDGNYIIIDPWGGKEIKLSQMQIYKNRGKFIGYVTLP